MRESEHSGSPRSVLKSNSDLEKMLTGGAEDKPEDFYGFNPKERRPSRQGLFREKPNWMIGNVKEVSRQ